MTNYGALFLGPETNVAFGDKVDRNKPHAANEGGRALHKRSLGGKVYEDMQLSADNTTGQRDDRRVWIETMRYRGVLGS